MTKKQVSNILEENIIAADGIAVIDNNKKIIVFNEAAQRITGYSEKDILFQEYPVLFLPGAADEDYIGEAIGKGKSFSNLSADIKTKDGKSLNVLVSISPLQPPGKPPAGVVLIFRNTREMELMVKSLHEKTREILNEKNRFQAIFNSRLEGTFTIDKEWKITSFNTSAEEITGYNSAEAVGRNCWTIFQSAACQNGCHMERTMKNGEAVRNNELVIVRKDGSKVPIRVNSSPLYNVTGEQIGGVETFQDITAFKNLSTHLEERYGFENIIGRSKSMQKIYELIKSVVQSDSTVLITGESGTGKELVARAIHLNSDRRLGPFMAVNCSAFVESLLESELFGHEKGAFTGAIRSKPGRFELADHGTLFLDEVGDMSPVVQVKLLRVLETLQFERVGGTRPIHMDVRIIAATNKNLDDEVRSGRFREDLYYRLNVINIELPPLRERMEDLPLLLEHFLEKFRKRFKKSVKGISPAAFRLLQKYHWPGNIRELENVLEHAFVLTHREIIQTGCLPQRLWQDMDQEISEGLSQEYDNPVTQAEKNHIQNILNKFNGHRAKAAAALGIDKSTLWRKMKKYGLL